MRIYGDPFDIYCDDSRAMPLQEDCRGPPKHCRPLSPAIEVMAMPGLFEKIDSTIIYFRMAYGHPCIVADALWLSYETFLNAAQAARRQGASAMQYYVWEGDCDSELEPRVQTIGDLAWSLGPY